MYVFKCQKGNIFQVMCTCQQFFLKKITSKHVAKFFVCVRLHICGVRKNKKEQNVLLFDFQVADNQIEK